MTKNKVEELAEEHAEWMAQFCYKLIKLVAKEEFKHGWKHRDENGK